MNYKILAPIAFALLAVGFVAGYLSYPQNDLPVDLVGGSPNDLPGVYYTTTSAHTLRDGTGAQVRVDINGRLILSN